MKRVVPSAFENSLIGFACALTLLFAIRCLESTASANEIKNPVGQTSAWIKTEKADGMGETYLHISSLSQSAGSNTKDSALNIYRIPATDKDVQTFVGKLKTASKPDPRFLPANCYLVNRNDLETSQTWCEPAEKSDAGSFVVVAESGPEKMGNREKKDLVLAKILGGTK